MRLKEIKELNDLHNYERTIQSRTNTNKNYEF